MRIHPSICRKTIPCLLLFISLVAASFCYADHQKTVEVVGVGECADCHLNNIKNTHALKGLRVTIDCKLATGEVKTRGVGELDGKGKFRVDFPQELVENGKLKEECYAQLHGASDIPCPTHNGIESSKVAFVSESNGKHTFSPVGKLKFSPLTCTSAFLWPFFKYPKKPFPDLHLPPITSPFKFFPPKKPCPPFFKFPFPHVPIYKKPLPPPVPVYEKPLPPPVPVYEKPLPPPVPVYEKPLPPPVPVYEEPLPPPVPVYEEPLPPPVPVYEKPLPPPVPVVKKPCPPIVKHPPIVPVYKPKPLPPPVPVYVKPLPPPVPVVKKPCPPIVPVYKPKPLPPIPKFPPLIKKPCPPIPKFPPLSKFHHHLKFPPKHFKHPKFKKWPSLPLYPPHP